MKFFARYITAPLHKKSVFLLQIFFSFLSFYLFFFVLFCFLFFARINQSCSLTKPGQKKINNDKTLRLIIPNYLAYEPFNTIGIGSWKLQKTI